MRTLTHETTPLAGGKASIKAYVTSDSSQDENVFLYRKETLYPEETGPTDIFSAVSDLSGMQEYSTTPNNEAFFRKDHIHLIVDSLKKAEALAVEIQTLLTSLDIAEAHLADDTYAETGSRGDAPGIVVTYKIKTFKTSACCSLTMEATNAVFLFEKENGLFHYTGVALPADLSLPEDPDDTSDITAFLSNETTIVLRNRQQLNFILEQDITSALNLEV